MSPSTAAVTGVSSQVAAHVPSMLMASVVQKSPSSQAAGQAPAEPAAIPVSHVSPGSTTPLPQVDVQSSSVVASAPAGQQPSPSAGAVIGALSHCTEQSVPLRTSEVQASPSSQPVGHAPASPAAMSGSHSSPSSSTPLPHSSWHSREQPSPLLRLPSSHSSPSVCSPSPQRPVTTMPSVAVASSAGDASTGPPSTGSDSPPQPTANASPRTRLRTRSLIPTTPARAHTVQPSYTDPNGLVQSRGASGSRSSSVGRCPGA